MAAVLWFVLMALCGPIRHGAISWANLRMRFGIVFESMCSPMRGKECLSYANNVILSGADRQTRHVRWRWGGGEGKGAQCTLGKHVKAAGRLSFLVCIVSEQQFVGSAVRKKSKKATAKPEW